MQNEIRIAIPADLDEKHRAMLTEIAGSLESALAIKLHYATLLIQRQDRGCFTPAEEFVEDLLLHWGNGGPPLTPELAAEALETFKEDFEDMANVARRVADLYPEAFAAAGGRV